MFLPIRPSSFRLSRGPPRSVLLQESNDSSPIAGIGGKGGHVYNVNRLKRNLLQETMVSFKDDLYQLIRYHPTREVQIVDKLQDLVLASPVSTTTDSILLDGTWSLAWQSQETPAMALLQPHTNTTVSKKPKHGFWWRLDCKLGEDLHEDESSHVQDTQRLVGRLITKRRTYALVGLTRRSLELQLKAVEWLVAGKTVLKQRSIHQSMRVDVLYLDVDLCILAEAGLERPFQVYSRRPQLAKRRRPVLLRSLRNVIRQKRRKQRQRADGVIFKNTKDEASELTVLRLGDIRDEEDESWDSETDPFVGLTADERQKRLKKMNINEVEQARLYRLKQAQRFGRRQTQRSTFFRKPSNTSQTSFRSNI